MSARQSRRPLELGPLRVVVNCAGVATPGKVLGREGVLPLANFEKVIAINLTGTFNVVRLAAEAMAASETIIDAATGTPERGVIINTASVAAFDGQIGQPAYSASKGAVAAMTLPLARELARHYIRVMTIAPGIFETPMMASLSAEAQASLGAQVPHPARLGQARGVRGTGFPHRGQPNAQRRNHPARRRHPHGAEVGRRFNNGGPAAFTPQALRGSGRKRYSGSCSPALTGTSRRFPAAGAGHTA